jgi:cell division protein FtsL
VNRVNSRNWLHGRHTTGVIAMPHASLFAEAYSSLTIGRALVLKRLAIIPTWVILPMILLAASCASFTVIVHARGELRASFHQYYQVTSEIELLRRDNASLGTEISRMTSDPITIESAARSRLGMVRPSDIVVPIKTRGGADLSKLSFVR